MACNSLLVLTQQKTLGQSTAVFLIMEYFTTFTSSSYRLPCLNQIVEVVNAILETNQSYKESFPHVYSTASKNHRSAI